MTTRLVPLAFLCCTVVSQAASISFTNTVASMNYGTWRFFRGTNEASLPDITEWRNTNFNDAAFVDAPAPFWYGDVRPGGTQLLDMQGTGPNNYTCFFLRRTFMVNNAAQVGGLKLDYFIDDGFIAWVNGVEVFRENVSGEPMTNTLAANQPIDPAPNVSMSQSTMAGLLHNGTNWLTVQVFNTSQTSSDIGFDCALATIVGENVPPTITSFSPPAGTRTELTQITVNFSEPVQGVTADDLQLNLQPATALSGSGSNYTFTFAQPPYGTVEISWFTNHGITDLSLPPNPFDGSAPSATWQYTLLDTVPPTVFNLFPPGGAVVRTLSQIEVTFSEEVNGVNASDLLINSQPATNVTRAPGGPYVFQFPAPPTGTVQVAWAGGHGITDQAPAPNAFAGGSWSYTFDPNASTGQLLINEAVASNQSGLLDEDGEQQDWIEIFNSGTTPVNLADWSLSDDAENPGLWTFPARTIAPGQYLVVFASGKDRKPASGPNRMHTNFQLSQTGEFLGLYTADSPRALVSAFSPFPEQRNDTSYGYDAVGNLRYFASPTPGGPNGMSSIVGVAEPVHFSVSRGFFSQPFNLALSCLTPAAIIRYTTDGSVPTAVNGAFYAAPLRLTNTTMVRAAAFRTGLLPSKIGTHSYLFHLTAAQRTLPVMNVVTATNNWVGRSGVIGMYPETGRAEGTAFVTNNPATDYHNPSQHGLTYERPVSAEYILPDGSTGFQVDCGIRVQGSDWQRPRTVPTSKFSFRLYFRGNYGEGRLNYPLFPLTSVRSFNQIVLRAGYNEKINPFIRNEITMRLSHDMGQVAPHGSLALVLLNSAIHTNDPGGAGIVPIYNPCERVHEEMLQSYFGGGSEWDVVGPDFATSSEGPGITDGDRIDFGRTLASPGAGSLMSLFWSNSTLRLITNPAAYVAVSQRLDLPNFVDYCLLNAYTAMGDWPANNWRAGRERATNAIWRFIPWDTEWAMGIYALAVSRDSFAFSGTGTEDAGLNSTGNSEIARIYQSLRPNPEFRLLWADRIQKHFFNGGALTGLNISNRFEQLRTEMLGFIPSIDTEILQWARDRFPIIMGQFNTYGLYGLSNALYGTFASSNAPAFNQHGGSVAPGFALTMAAPLGGSIYFTTNGNDPRVPFSGAVSNAAVTYSGPVTLSSSVRIKARTLLDGTNWSALADAQFTVASLGIPLRFTELNYNPTNAAHEFLEIQNIGSAAVDMSLMTLDDAVTFTFLQGTTLAAGARLVLATGVDPAAFAARYPGVTVAGYYSGALNNGGERVVLRDRFGNIITSATYDDEGGWATAADGGNRSLEVLNPSGDPDDPANWVASTQLGGTPGAGSTPPTPTVRLNEILAANTSVLNHGGTFPDFVELYNAGGSPVNVGGWSLSDDGNARKYILPSTTIAAGGYLIVWLDANTNTTPGLHAGFSMDPDGDSLFLYDAATNRLDAVTLGVQLPDYSVGRVGGQWVLTTVTTNAPNIAAATAAQSSLIINEWMANPLPGADDWIELYNTAALPVALRGLYLSTTSIVHQVTSLSFIGPFGFVQFLADQGVGARHLDFNLPAAGGSIILSDATAVEINRVSYASAVEGVSRGRLPDGSGTLADFSSPGSPGTNNFLVTYSGPILNEVLARNQGVVINGGRYADFIELLNTNATSASLAGLSLSVGGIEPGQWTFPPDASLGGGSYVVVWCDGGRAASTNSGDYNTGRWLDGDSGGIYLFNPARQLVNSVEFGFQIVDKSIGLSGGQWRLLATPTVGAVNSAAAPLGSSNLLRLNEWMANPVSGNDWFEIYNGTNLPVSMGGLILTDDPSTAGMMKFRVPALSFIGPKGFVKWVADGEPGDGRNHVNFALDDEGESIQIYSTNGAAFNLIDSVTFGTQLAGVSQGRLPDGAANITTFPGSASPAEPNYTLLPDLVINEILTHTDPPLEDAVELRNTGANTVNLGGWFLSDSQDNFMKYRIPDGTSIAAGGFAVFYAGQFDTGPNAFNFNSAHGEEVWLSAADAAGVLTGYRVGAKFGASANGVSFGRFRTSVGVDYPAMSARTFGVDSPATVAQFRTGTGAANPAPLVGPVVISELMYHPPTGINGSEDEYIELLNVSGAPVKLFDPINTTNTWRLEGADFTFPPNFTLGAGSNALVVNFSPTDSAALAAFRGLYSVPSTVPVFGPYSGRLSNDGETIDLFKPDPPQPPPSPDAGFVPYILVDRVSYTDKVPWPSGTNVDGGGLSLQRKSPTSYGNEPLNWVASTPTAGSANSLVVAPPTVLASPQGANVLEGATMTFNVAADGTGPLKYQWRFNGDSVPNATNATFTIGYAVVEDSGAYDAVVSNPGGSALSAAAALAVLVPPLVLAPPVSQIVNTGATVNFTVVARGTPPLTYQWRFNGTNLPGAASPSITRSNVKFPDDDGLYEVLINSPAGMTSASATLSIRVTPLFLISPISQSVVAGGDASFSASIAGNPSPFTYYWRRVTVPAGLIAQSVSGFRSNFVTFNTTAAGFVLANNMAMSNVQCRLVVSNLASIGQGVAATFNLTLLADSDSDGIPDVWETLFGLDPTNAVDRNLDADGDKMSNWSEYIAGTDPTNSLSYLGVSLTAGPASAVVSFGAMSNHTYTVQFTDNLGLGVWSKLADVLALPNNRVETIPDPTYTSNRFYRAVTPRAP
ncbi:MAG TPA: lamin tail domain-containing protein [Verrucomicrobiae bacterium]|nr:lamin tail domain-containing protein [Verrucomicrobiae bacterium]